MAKSPTDNLTDGLGCVSTMPEAKIRKQKVGRTTFQFVIRRRDAAIRYKCGYIS